MTAVSLAISRGQEGTRISDFTVGTTAPGAGDIQLCFNLLDTNSKALTDLDVIKACRAFILALQSGGNTVFVTNSPPL
jgi:hypothetical protein